MNMEIELKARVDAHEPVRERLRELGGELVQERGFEDNYLLDRDDGDLHQSGSNLRVRLFSGAALLTWKGPREIRDGIRSREEIETVAADGPLLLELLGRLGYQSRFRYQKYREIWELDDVEVMLDEIPLGLFLEIEGTDETVRQAANALAIDDEQVVTQSYPALFLARLALTGEEQRDMLFEQPADPTSDRHGD